MGPKNKEDPEDKKRREKARKLATQEQIRTAQGESVGMTQDLQAAYGPQSLFTVAQRMARL